MENSLSNGCGGKGSWIKVPNFIFEASCNKHDIGYGLGGNEASRFECDGKFFIMMIKDTFKVKGWFKRFYYQLWAFVYFLAVRLKGNKFYNYL
jgi:hypothetical protein